MKAICFAAFLLCLTLSFSSCKKEVENNTTTKSKTELLTSKLWIYDEYIINYNQANSNVAYKRGRANNMMDLSLNKVKYNADGTYQETTETGAVLSGTWKFLNGETQTEVKNANGTFTSSIAQLTETSYTWHDQTANRYGKMIPQ